MTSECLASFHGLTNFTFIGLLIIEAWLGKTNLVHANSILELLFNVIKLVLRRETK